METHQGKSVPVVKGFQVEGGSWTPVTPLKPTLARSRPIYEDGHFMTDSEDYLSRFSQQNQAQTLLSCSISSSERSIPNYHQNNNNNIWDVQSHERINMDRENVDLQRRVLKDYLPHWSSQGRRTMPSSGSGNGDPSSYSSFSSWELPLSWEKNGIIRENGSMLELNSADPLAQFDNMSFGDLLAIKGSVLEPSMVSTNSLFPGWNSQLEDNSRLGSSTTFRNQEALQGLNQQINGIYGQVMQNSAFPCQGWSLSNVNSTPSTMHVNGMNSSFAPPTPHSRWKQESIVASGDTNLGTQQKPNEQNGLQEHEVAAAMVDLNSLNNKEVTGVATDLSPRKVSIVEEDHNPDKGDNQVIDLNRTPQKKPRRKRYMPKVIRENKPKRTPKPKTPKPTESKEAPRTKRKYVRKNKMNIPSTNSPVEETQVVDPKPTNPAFKSCKRSLNFDLNSNGELYADTQTNDCHTAGNHTLNRGLKSCVALPEYVNLESSNPDQTILTKDREKAQSPNSSPCASSNEGVQTRGSKRAHSSITDTANVDAGNMGTNHSTFWQPNQNFLPNVDIHGVPRWLFPEIHKKKRTDKGQKSHTSSTSSSVTASEDQAAGGTHIHQRVDPIASKYYHCNLAPYGTNTVTNNNQVEVLMRCAENRMQLLNTWLDISRLKRKKRSKGTTRVRDLAPLKGIASVLPSNPAAKCPRGRKSDIPNTLYGGNSSYINQLDSVRSCMEALAEDTRGNPKSKRRYRKQNSAVDSRSLKVKRGWDLVLYDGNQFIRNTTGSIPVLPLVKRNSLEAITEGLKQLNINREGCKISHQEHKALVPYHVDNQEQNALVLYKKDGTLVPYEGQFDPVRKRRQRAKVDLDDETTRVWRLLLENIDNKGIDGTDEEKAKWWENERGVFRGRVDSFIARMRLVQGDRRFTPWKGSVLDSVIGVFLTQNVSDHLSSSAFMSLAARFPIKSERSESTFSEEATSALVVEPQVYIIEPEESITWIEKSLDQPICDSNSRIIQEIDHIEGKEVVNSNEMIGGVPGPVSPVDYSAESSQRVLTESRIKKHSHTTEAEAEAASIQGYDRARDDATSSQQSVISSQNSVNSPNFQTAGIMNTFSESNSIAQALESSFPCHYFDCSTSFMGLLKMAESPLLHDSYSQCVKYVAKDSPEAPRISSADYQLHEKLNFNLKATTCIEMIEVESKSSDTLRKDENSTTEQSNLTTESTVQPFVKEKRSSCYVLEGENMVMQSQMQSRNDSLDNVVSSAQGQTSSTWKSPNLLNPSYETADVTESTTAFNRANNDHKVVEQISEYNYASGGISGISNANPTKSKSARTGKDKRNTYDWDNLRKQAQVNGRNKERPAHTRDSIDWEAVRHADVSILADTIKERGMNNMLAGRIKDLLDRLVKEHGSIDLEWLRDIPPDKAKEYLLSFRGLGLKSVECVRLLTLHHLAFPVDTNVGRIAVRLGWVPLQPLPESLQLHLLEMYPILESIQQYLWPRLCKLDQKTLYELHYHMITFGKVFCTKRQPNCNACPLRGECRHFASAFASARFALPGPEERSIVASSGGSSSHVHHQVNINLLPLPPPSWGYHHLETNFGCNKEATISELPCTPLSLSLPQTIHHLERKSQVNCEPIVEVPASPEPEPEQTLCDIEDTFYEDPNEILRIELNMENLTQTLQNFMQANRELQESGMSRALVALTPEAASIPTPKLKNISRLRTEHHVYELPDTHALLKGLDKREPDDPCSYLLAIWTPGETANSIQPPDRRCSSDASGILCNEDTCFYCSSQREANSQIVRGTLLIPCRTAMRGSFPLNGTYFQVNEVFADHDSSLNPIEVPRSCLWNLSRRTVYFGTSVPTIFRGLTTEDIQHCFWRGYVCVRGFDRTTRAPRPLMARLHFPASKMPRREKGKANDE